MSSAVSNITGHYKTANGATLSIGQVICGAGNNIITDITNVELTISSDIAAISNVVSNTINSTEAFISNTITTALNYEQDAVNYVTNAVFSEVKVIEGKIEALLPNVDFCGIFNANNLSKTFSGVSQYYTVPNVNVALNYLNPTSASTIRPLPSQGDQLIGQSQVHRLARNVELEFTDLYHKISKRVKFITGPFYASSWSEPVSSYNGEYPHNQVMKTRNGITVEYDDTPGAVRIHHYHPSGSYHEINNTGRVVNKTVDDNFEIILKDKKLYVRGSLDITVDSGVNIMVTGNANIDVGGNIQAAVRGDLNAVVSGNTLFNTANNTIFKSNNIIVESNTFTLLSNTINQQSNAVNIKSGNITTDVSGDINFKSQSTNFDTKDLSLSSSNISSPSSWTDNGYNDPASPPLLALGGTSAKSSPSVKSITGTQISAPAYPVAAAAVNSQLTDPVQQHIHNNIFIKQIMYFDSGMPTTQVPSNLILVPESYAHIKYSNGAAINISGSVTPKNIDTSIITNDNIKLNTVISKNFTLGDVTKYAQVTHDTILVPPISKVQVVKNLMYLTQNVLDPLVDNFGRGSVLIASGYQNYNQVAENDHNTGQAVDVQFNDIPYTEYQNRIQQISSIIPFDKIIFCWAWNGDEYIPWVHISLKAYQPPSYQSFSFDVAHGVYSTGIQNPFSIINNQSSRTDGISI